MSQSQSSVCGSGCHCPQHRLLQQPPWGEGLVSAPDGTQDFLDGLSPTSCLGTTAAFSGFVDAHTSRNMVTQGLIWSIVTTEVFATAAALSCHHLTTHTGIPKPPSNSQTVSDSIMFFTFFLLLLFFFLLLTSNESFIFPIRLLVKKQLQSLCSLSLEVNF